MTTSEKPPKKYWTRRRIIVTLLVLLGVWWFCFRGVTLKISPETTKITEPRTADRKRVDYYQALVSLSEPNVPPSENGFRMIAEAVGRIPCENINLNYWRKVCQKLDLDPVAPPTTAYYKKMRRLIEAANEELGITKSLDDPEKIANRPEGMPEDAPQLWDADRAAWDWIFPRFEQIRERPWTGDEDRFTQVVELHIQDISPVLDLLGKAVREDVYYIPYFIPEFEGENGTCSDILLPCLQLQREFARDLNRRIMYSLGKGELDKAIDDIITIFRMGQHLQKENFAVIRLVGNYMQSGIGFPAAVHLMRDSRLTREQIERLATELESLPAKAPLLDMHLAQEYMMYDIISALSEKKYAFNLFVGETVYGSGPSHKPLLDWLNYYGYDWNVVARTAGKIYQRQTDILNEPDPMKRRLMKDALLADMTQIQQRHNKLSSYWRMIFVSTRSKMMGDSIGKYFTSSYYQYDLESTVNQGEMAIDLLRLACALELYKADEGRYPDKLDKLQGKYLAEVPGDPCTETKEPFRYCLEERDADESGQPRYGYFMYGLGRGGKDHGGKTCFKIPGTEELFAGETSAEHNLPIRK